MGQKALTALLSIQLQHGKPSKLNGDVKHEETSIQVLDHENSADNDDNGLCAVSTTRIQAAVDSGSVDNVMHPGEVPDGIHISPHPHDRHFVGANNTRIENYGTCTTAIKSKTDKGEVDAQCGWTLADVSRPLHSVSKLCGPMEQPKQDVLFNSKKCVVVPPGVVDKVLEHIDPLLQYNRQGGLYTTEIELSPFHRQGAEA